MHMWMLAVQNRYAQSGKGIIIQSPKQNISFNILGPTIKWQEKTFF